jgi:hypothetical protein
VTKESVKSDTNDLEEEEIHPKYEVKKRLEMKCLVALSNIPLLPLTKPPPQVNSVRHNRLLITNNSIRLLLAQLLRALPVVGVDRCVEEITHVVDDGARLTCT